MCVHGFIDGNDGAVYQALPWTTGDGTVAPVVRGSGNKPHIGVWRCGSLPASGTQADLVYLLRSGEGKGIGSADV